MQAMSSDAKSEPSAEDAAHKDAQKEALENLHIIRGIIRRLWREHSEARTRCSELVRRCMHDVQAAAGQPPGATRRRRRKP